MTTLYGIPNCGSVKAARKWLAVNNIAYDFHDYKKLGIERSRLAAWAKAVGWEPLLNKRGTTFRRLDDADKADLNEKKALDLLVAHLSMIKRPIIEHGSGVIVGFDENEWRAAELSD
ncbi:MAG: arsenate reductase [Pacificimonas sp.]